VTDAKSKRIITFGNNRDAHWKLKKIWKLNNAYKRGNVETIERVANTNHSDYNWPKRQKYLKWSTL